MAADVLPAIATIDEREPDFLRDGIDLAIVKRPARGAARNPLEMPLLSEIVFPVCSPSLLDGASSLRNFSELARYPLIECDAAESEDSEFGWSAWLSRLGLGGAPPRLLRFSQFGPALSAAVDGLGVALGRSPMLDAELAAGRLVRPFPSEWYQRRRMYLPSFGAIPTPPSQTNGLLPSRNSLWMRCVVASSPPAHAGCRNRNGILARRWTGLPDGQPGAG